MKKLFLISIIILIFAVPVLGVDMILGAKSGYYAWRPYFKDFKKVQSFTDLEIGQGILYGPVMSILFSDSLTFSIAGLYGYQSAYWSNHDEYLSFMSAYSSGTYTLEVERFDIDSALSYRLTKNLKTFIGYKYQATESTIQLTSRESSTTNDDDIKVYEMTNDIAIYSHGPALGLGYSVVFGERFFATVNISLLYMLGNIEVKRDGFEYDGNPGVGFGGDTFIDNSTTHMGFNCEPSIGLLSGKDIIITLGARVQWIRTEIQDLEGFQRDIAGGSLNDYFYGVFVSIMFVF